MRPFSGSRKLLLTALVLLIAAGAPMSAVTVALESDSSAGLLETSREQRESGNRDDTSDGGVVHQFDTGPMLESNIEPEPEAYGQFQRVFPPDTRQHISPTTHYPASAVVYVEKWVNGVPVATCSGTFVSANAVLTAAHCLYTHDTGWGSAMRIVPAKDGQLEPFGDAFANFGWVPAAWEQQEHPEWDWGILSLASSSLGNEVGWFTMGVLPTASLMAPDFHPAIAGYPGDKPFGTMWFGTQASLLDANHAFLAHRIDTAPGQSGSAVWRGDDGVIVGIHVFGLQEYNLASRVNEELIGYLIDACNQMTCAFDYIVEDAGPIDPDPDPDQPPPQQPDPDPDPPATDSPAFATGQDSLRAVDNFGMTRNRTDLPIDAGYVNRTWMWGPYPYSAAIEETYIGAPGDTRVVQYFDKSRMEDNQYRADPPWHVTNGLLVMELITGRMQISDDAFIDRSPADVQIAGDDHPDSPTYAMLDPLRTRQPYQVGEAVIRRLQPDGSTPHDNALIPHHVVADVYVPETNHTVASVFWDFMNSSGVVHTAQGFTIAMLFENPFYATGFPITEAYWVHVPVGGQWQDVLFQCFQRRCLTYTPGNSPGWQVEAGNVGQHYFRWRYGDSPAWP